MTRLGIDVGGTKTVAVLLDAGGLVAAEHEVPTERGERVVDSVLVAAREVLGGDARSAGIAGIGLGMPGQIGADRSSVRNAVHLGLGAFDVGAAVSAGLGAPVTVDNDVKAAVVGARHILGDRIAATQVAYLGLGTGIAAGVELDGVVLRGASGVAGEIGHVPVPGSSARCRCGQVGCLETVAAGWALAERWGARLPAARMLAAARSGDPRGTGDWHAVVDALAHAIRSMVLTLDVGAIVLGGGISRLGDPLLDGIRARLDAWSDDAPFLASLAIASRLHIVPPGSQPAAVGAAILGSPTWKS